MSAGKRYKFQGSTIQLMTGFAETSPTHNLTAATKANPCVITVEAGHTIVEGDVFKITNVVGMEELNDDIYIAEDVSGNDITLADVDSTGYGTYVSGGEINEGVFSNFCELTNYNRQGGTSPEIPATTVCSTAAEYEIGLPDFGTTALDFNFAPLTSDVQGVLHDFYLSGDKTAVKVTLPRNGGSFIQQGFVQQESETAGNGGLWTATTTLRNTGNRFDQAAS